VWFHPAIMQGIVNDSGRKRQVWGSLGPGCFVFAWLFERGVGGWSGYLRVMPWVWLSRPFGAGRN
jgi:hypothetical protein